MCEKRCRCKDIQKLIDAFESDLIKFNLKWNFDARFGRSDAQKKLVSMGEKSLPYIILHLEKNPPTGFMDLHIGWGNIFYQIIIKIEPEKTELPKLNDIEGWLMVAKKHTREQYTPT